MIAWQTPLLPLTLKENEVHLWCVNLNIPTEKIPPLTHILSQDELTRANRFRFEHHQQRFIVSRSHLRLILGQYLNQKPEALQFTYTEKGKPYIPEYRGLEFNMSNSETLALYGITRDRSIGVDLEHLRRMEDAAQLAKRFFCPNEYERISPLKHPEKEKAFFRIWTAKEAFLKATGEGIAGGLDRVEFTLKEDDSVELIQVKGSYQEASQWSFFSFIPHPEYIGAVVIQGQISVKQFFQLPTY